MLTDPPKEFHEQLQLGTCLLCQYNFEHNGVNESIKHNASTVCKCKMIINSNIKHLWKIVVNDQYILIEQHHMIEHNSILDTCHQ